MQDHRNPFIFATTPFHLRSCIMPNTVRHPFVRLLLAIALMSPLTGCGKDNPPPVTFSLVEVGTLGGNESYACALNASGQTVGYSSTKNAAEFHAFLWDGKALADLGKIAGSPGCTFGINDKGEISGAAHFNDDHSSNAAVWTGPTPTDLGVIGFGNAINSSGQVAGVGFIASRYLTRAVRWDNLKMTDLGTLGGKTSMATAINDKGWVLGYSDTTGDTEIRAVIWKGTEATPLDSLGGRFSLGMAMNNNDEAVGSSGIVADYKTHAALWKGKTPNDLGTLPGGDSSMAFGINDAGVIVGMSNIKEYGPKRAAIWIDHKAYDLTSGLDDTGKGWTIMQAQAINANGQITGWGVSPSGQPRGFVITPTKPIPLSVKPAQ